MIVYNRSEIEPFIHKELSEYREKKIWREVFIDYTPIVLLVLTIILKLL